MKQLYRTVMIGFGAVAHGYVNNKSFMKEFPIPTHFEAIKDNIQLDLDTVVDVDLEKVISAQCSLKIENAVGDVLDVPDPESVEILTVTCPPAVKKIDLVKTFPNLKGLVLEKPLGMKPDELLELEAYAENKGIKTQVAYLRRSDEFLIGLNHRGLEALIGHPIKVDITYGNGFRNNGSHLVDLIRMILGEIDEVIFARDTSVEGLVLEDDKNISTTFRLATGIHVAMQPVDFRFYRENSIDIWGTEGRLVLSQEGSYYQYWKVKESRFGDNYKGEIDWARPDKVGRTKLGYSFRKMYKNLLDNIEGKEDLLSPIKSAITTERVIMDVMQMSDLVSRSS